MTTAGSRLVYSKVYWCSISETWMPLEDGPACPMDWCLETSATHRMRKRWFWICQDCRHCYTTRLASHECEGPP